MSFSHFNRTSTLNGLLLSLLFAFSAMYIGGIPMVKAMGVSPMVLAIFLGMIYANTLRRRLPDDWVPGIQFAAKNVLRFAIVFYGFNLTFSEVIGLGWPVLALDLGVILTTLLMAWLVGVHILRLDRDTSMLVGSGAGICGAAAVMAAEGTLRSEPHKAAGAVATVVLFGTLAMVLYPWAQANGLLGMTPHQFGVFAGATVHEVAQVVVVGAAVGPEASVTAVTTKMGRVLMLAPVLLLMGWLLSRLAPIQSARQPDEAVLNDATDALLKRYPGLDEIRVEDLDGELRVWLGGDMSQGDFCAAQQEADAALARALAGQPAVAPRKPPIPWFVVMFLVMVGVHSMGVVPAVAVDVIVQIDQILLTMAMAALGIETTWAKLKKSGPRTFVLAAVLFAWLTWAGSTAVKLWI
jgi:uncharacterized integral membrane protein (TIGR00698 family)